MWCPGTPADATLRHPRWGAPHEDAPAGCRIHPRTWGFACLRAGPNPKIGILGEGRRAVSRPSTRPTAALPPAWAVARVERICPRRHPAYSLGRVPLCPGEKTCPGPGLPRGRDQVGPSSSGGAVGPKNRVVGRVLRGRDAAVFLTGSRLGARPLLGCAVMSIPVMAQNEPAIPTASSRKLSSVSAWVDMSTRPLVLLRRRHRRAASGEPTTVHGRCIRPPPDAPGLGSRPVRDRTGRLRCPGSPPRLAPRRERAGRRRQVRHSRYLPGPADYGPLSDRGPRARLCRCDLGHAGAGDSAAGTRGVAVCVRVQQVPERPSWGRAPAGRSRGLPPCGAPGSR
jgi:hypothetical protein